ncbi:MAG: glycosyltransferase family 4 protein [Ilumatobacter sp.]|uniref:glycosyltransferase family 4 protein n=1 Tax=Ilumatobacter sp. TaxID=1967498 RepID=UPI0032990227
MKVIVLTPFYRPGVGGSGQLIDDISQALAQRGDDVAVLTYSFDIDAEADFDTRQPFPIHRIAAWHWRRSGSAQSAVALLRLCFTFRPDVIVCGAAFPTALIAMVARFTFGTPYVVYTHGEDVSFRSSQRIAPRLSGMALARAAAVIANSSFSAQQSKSLMRRPRPVDVVHPWIDVSAFAPADDDHVDTVRRRHGLGGQRLILTVARMELRKGHDRVVQALPEIAASFPDVRYMIIGKGDAGRIMGIAAEVGVADRMLILDYVSPDDLPAYYRLAEVYTMVPRCDPDTGFVEGFGMVFVEAAAAGRPTVASSEGGCRDAVVDGETGLLVDPDDAHAVAEAVICLLGDPDRAAQMGARGFDRAKQFSSDRQLARIAERITSAVANRRQWRDRLRRF